QHQEPPQHDRGAREPEPEPPQPVAPRLAARERRRGGAQGGEEPGDGQPPRRRRRQLAVHDRRDEERQHPEPERERRPPAPREPRPAVGGWPEVRRSLEGSIRHAAHYSAESPRAPPELRAREAELRPELDVRRAEREVDEIA